MLFQLHRDLAQLDRFRVGMSYAQVQAETHERYALHRYGIEFDTPPTAAEMQVDPLYWMYVSDEGTMLQFNHHKVLLSASRHRWLGIDILRVLNRVAEWVHRA